MPSKLAIYAAIAANVAIAVTKLVVAGITGSSAMLSEGIHSSVDSFNGVILLLSIRLSQRPSLIVAVLVFGFGGGISFYEGAQHIGHPQPLPAAPGHGNAPIIIFLQVRKNHYERS